VDEIQRITRLVAGLGAVRFRKNVPRQQLFEALNTDSRSRTDIYADGLAARDAWAEADPAWVIKVSNKDNEEIQEQITVGGFGSLLASCLERQKTHSAKFQAWRLAASTVNTLAQTLDEESMAWFEEATRLFREGTAAGDMIRTTVPTTTRPDQPVGQAVISVAMVSGNEIHLDCTAQNATKWTFLQKAPGSPAYVVVVADLTEPTLTLQGQATGQHSFKVFGSNSTGEGPESAPVSVMVAQSQAA
jgi:hypothetical protein